MLITAQLLKDKWFQNDGFCSFTNNNEFTGKNNRLPFLDILEYLKNTHKNPKFVRVRQVPIWELCQIWDFYGYSLNTLKYPKMGITYFFLWKLPTIPPGLAGEIVNTTHSRNQSDCRIWRIPPARKLEKKINEVYFILATDFCDQNNSRQTK